MPRKTIVLHRSPSRGNRTLKGARRCKTDGALCRVSSYQTKGNTTMERVTLRIPKQQIEEVEQMVETGEFPNRSEAIRAAVRDMLNEQADGNTETTSSKRTWAKV